MAKYIVDADRIAATSFVKFHELPKTGKPKTGAEWTVLSCILQYHEQTDQLDVIALGTGTKCLSGEAVSKLGDRLNDSHAEVIARRAFKRYLLEEMQDSVIKLNKNDGEVASDQDKRLFRWDAKQQIFRIRDGISFHFFTTHPPCGDGSIFGDCKEIDGGPDNKKPRLEANVDAFDSVGVALKVDGFTGGKLINADNNTVDLMAQNFGAVRTKPGRGPRTLSVSCSDKLSRWCFAGCQGGLLMTLLEQPIYLETFTLCGISDVDAIERAIWKRWNVQEEAQPDTFQLHKPLVLKTSSHLLFEYKQTSDLQPSPNSLIWCPVKERYFNK